MLDYRYTVLCVGAVLLFEMEAVHLYDGSCMFVRGGSYAVV